MDYKIVTKFIKDVSFEIPNVETFLFFEENIENYEIFTPLNVFILFALKSLGFFNINSYKFFGLFLNYNFAYLSNSFY